MRAAASLLPSARAPTDRARAQPQRRRNSTWCWRSSRCRSPPARCAAAAAQQPLAGAARARRRAPRHGALDAARQPPAHARDPGLPQERRQRLRTPVTSPGACSRRPPRATRRASACSRTGEQGFARSRRSRRCSPPRLAHAFALPTLPRAGARRAPPAERGAAGAGTASTRATRPRVAARHQSRALAHRAAAERARCRRLPRRHHAPGARARAAAALAR